ncbi:hypothetical protein SAMN04489712_10179 [Thermomonospora echinospora]|uniref:Peptidase MA superfamily protein n=1 Tax=Thermomonospora echinospora TaxID=1992 RepID=A0A1H5S557_9ACTN|nr:hypothetical protein [Thermomonospora echinospora]SEF45600.1 hypothetical protein SAMN04489712_10179 [Thermomonospora echinospora]
MDDPSGTPATGTGRRGTRRPVLVVSALVTAVVLIAGAVWGTTRSGGSPAPAGTATGPAVPPDARAVEAVLAGRARAVRDGDRTAFLATVITAPPAFREAQRTLFDNLARLPLRSWREDLDSSVPVAGGRDGSTLKVTLRYRLRGYDRGEVTRTRYLTVARRGGGWRIVGDGTAHGLRDDADIWDGGPLTVVRGEHSLVIGSSPALREIADRLDAAVPAVTEVVGRRWARRAVALVPADDGRAAALVPGNGAVDDPLNGLANDPADDLANIAALATSGPSGEDRIVIAPGTFSRLNPLGREVVLTHELTHVATGGARDTRTPLWLIEGLADYVGYRDRAVPVRSAARELRAEVAAGRLPEALPGRDDFESGSDRLPQAYAEAWLACRMIAERYGEAALLRLYRAAGERSQDAALRSVLDLDTAELTAMWRDHLRKELG